MKFAYQIEATVRNNIGDVLQGMVAKAFLPDGSLVADRENYAELHTEGPVFLVANGWYIHELSQFPPPDEVVPLYISVHIANSALLRSVKVRTHFKEHSPIGARDRKTLHLLRAWNIPSYYSGCLTVTAAVRGSTDEKSNAVLVVDNVDHPLPADVLGVIEREYGTIERVSHDPPQVGGGTSEYSAVAEMHMDSLLKRYCAARLVVTTKIHCALPCIGMGVRVLLIHPNPDDPRLDTVRELIPIVSYKEILERGVPEAYGPRQRKLQKRKYFLSRIVREAVSRQLNPVRYPKSINLLLLKLWSIAGAAFFSIALRLAFNLGWKQDQLRKVFAV